MNGISAGRCCTSGHHRSSTLKTWITECFSPVTGLTSSKTLHRRTTTNTQALNNLNQFTGTENHYRHPGILYTDGIKFLAENADCFWLIDTIASYQPAVRQNQRLNEFQLWNLEVADHSGFSSGVLTCMDGDSEIPFVTQQIERTDFPLPSIRLYVENGVLLLPSEH
jgi:hypothetical protein